MQGGYLFQTQLRANLANQLFYCDLYGDSYWAVSLFTASDL